MLIIVAHLLRVWYLGNDANVKLVNIVVTFLSRGIVEGVRMAAAVGVGCGECARAVAAAGSVRSAGDR